MIRHEQAPEFFVGLCLQALKGVGQTFVDGLLGGLREQQCRLVCGSGSGIRLSVSVVVDCQCQWQYISSTMTVH